MSRITNRLGWGVAGALGIALLATLAGVIYAGPLAPPAAPSATGPTQIFSLPYTISSPGSYVVEGDLTCTSCTSGQNGITISASDVTLDLGGFRVNGVAGSGSGIAASGTPANVEIRNGEVLDWGGDGITLGDNSRLDDLRVHDNQGYGIVVTSESILTQSHITANPLGDVFIDGGNNLISNNVIEDSSVIVDVLGTENKVDGNVIAGGHGIGIRVRTPGHGNTISNNTVNGFDSYGIDVEGYGNDIEDNIASDNTASGIVVAGNSNNVRGNTASGNYQLAAMDINGILVTSYGNTIADNTTDFNGSAGIKSTGDLNIIVGNHASNNASQYACSDFWITGAGSGTVVANNFADNSTVCGLFFFDAPKITAHGNTARNIGVGGGYGGSCSTPATCDIAPITTAALATNPYGNIEN